MSEEKKGLGVFVNKRADKAAAAANAPGGPKKDVKKRWLYVGAGFLGLVVLSTTIFGDNGPKGPVVKKEEVAGTVSVNPPKADKAAFESAFAQDAASLRAIVEDLKKDASRRDEEVAKLKLELEKKAAGGGAPTGLPPGVVPPPVAGGNTGGLGQLGGGVVPPPPVPPTIPTGSGAPKLGEPPVINVPPSPSVPSNGGSNQGGDPLVFDAPTKASGASNLDPNNPPTANGVKAKVDYRKNPNAGLLPAGAFAPVSLLNGLDAGTSSATQSNPMPVLMNVTDQATLPGAAKYRLKSCFVLGTGYGDMSSERVYIRFSRLSCVDRADKLVLSQDVAGYVVDSDGKLGMRGTLINRQGAVLGRTVLAGFAQGLAGTLSSAQSTVTSNLGTGTNTSSLTGSAALRASGLSGAQAAASQLAEFYLKEAQSIFPVISIDAGRTATIVFSGSVGLNWGASEGAFTQNVTPTGSTN